MLCTISLIFFSLYYISIYLYIEVIYIYNRHWVGTHRHIQHIHLLTENSIMKSCCFFKAVCLNKPNLGYVEPRKKLSI